MITLAGDIGGTKTILAIFDQAQGLGMPLAEKVFKSADFDSFEGMVEGFLQEHDLQPVTACFGVAGPVIAGSVNITKLPWSLSEQELQERLAIPSVRLLNDLAATAKGLEVLGDEDFFTLQEGVGDPKGTKAVIAPGTGLGEAFLSWDGQKFQVHASEGGHCLWAPQGPEQVRFFEELWDRHEYVSYDLICSGRGIPLIYDFLQRQADQKPAAWLSDQLAGASDLSPVIVKAALQRPDDAPVCVRTLEIFCSILASEAANLAVQVLASGGVYLGGGIPPRIVSFLKNEKFLETFLRRGPLRPILTKMPVRVILNPKTALLGAGLCGLELIPIANKDQS